MTIPEGFAQVTHIFGGTSQPNGSAVIYGVEHGGIITPAAAATAARGAWDGTMLTSQVAAITHVRTDIKFGPDDTGPSASSASSNTGTGSGSAAPPNVCFLAQKNTALGGRRGRGRLYMPGVNEAGIDPNGALVGANLSQFQTDLNDFLAALDAAGLPMVLLHGPATEWVLVDGQPRRVPVAGSVPVPTPVSSLTASSVCATQRRRLRG